MEKLSIFFTTGLVYSVLFIGLVLVSCESDDVGAPAGPQLTGNSETYTLFSQSDPNISGTVEFAERDDNVTVVTISLTGTQAGADHPAHIHANTAAETGAILVDLTNIDGASGQSVTEVDSLNDGTAISYGELIDLNGYINVHLSSGELATLVAQGDIGQNALTANAVTYTLSEVSDPNINGTATFAERRNGNTLVTIQLAGTQAGFEHPAHIHENDAATGGDIVVSLNNVVGETGLSATSVSQLDDGTAVSYDDLITFNGHLNVHLSSQELTILVAQGDIGSNNN